MNTNTQYKKLLTPVNGAQDRATMKLTMIVPPSKNLEKSKKNKSEKSRRSKRNKNSHDAPEDLSLNPGYTYTF